MTLFVAAQKAGGLCSHEGFLDFQLLGAEGLFSFDSGLGFGVLGLGFWVLGLGFKVWGLGWLRRYKWCGGVSLIKLVCEVGGP